MGGYHEITETHVQRQSEMGLTRQESNYTPTEYVPHYFVAKQ